MNLQSRITKILLAIILVFAGIMAYAAANDQLMVLPQQLLGSIAVPFQKATAAISSKIDFWKDKYIDIDQIQKENQQLKEEINKLRKQQIDYDKIAMENQQYKEYLSIKKEQDSYNLISASVIGRDGIDKFYSFTIDVGEKDGIKKNDAVMTAAGLVGVVVEVGPNFARVATILSPSVSVGCFVSSTRDIGVVNGEPAHSINGNTVMSFLPKNTKAQKGELISTTGLGTIFPEDLVVGTIETVEVDDSGNSKYAVVKPIVDIAQVKMVFVVTNYQDN